MSRLDTVAGDMTGKIVEEEHWEVGACRAQDDASLCEAYEHCPFAQNARWLQEQRLRERFLDTLRAAELAGGRRLTYRDLLGASRSRTYWNTGAQLADG